MRGDGLQNNINQSLRERVINTQNTICPTKISTRLMMEDTERKGSKKWNLLESMKDVSTDHVEID